jgi:hypothetical protein
VVPGTYDERDGEYGYLYTQERPTNKSLMAVMIPCSDNGFVEFDSGNPNQANEEIFKYTYDISIKICRCY